MNLLKGLRRTAQYLTYPLRLSLLRNRHRLLIEEVNRYRCVHKGKTALIVGNGPSVKLHELERVSDMVTFTCNRFHLAYPKTSFRPDYLVSVDPQMISDFGIEMATKCRTTAFLNSSDLAGQFPNAHYLPLISQPKFAFSEDITKGFYDSGSVVIAAIQIAYFMGIKDIYLYGIDHFFNYKLKKCRMFGETAIGEGNHFIENYRAGREWRPPKAEQIEFGYKVCKQFLQQRNGTLKNTTKRSRLTIVDQEPLENLLLARDICNSRLDFDRPN